MPPNSEELMRIALRVLGAYTAREHPDAQDIELLRSSVSGPESKWDADRLARHVVEAELQRRR